MTVKKKPAKASKPQGKSKSQGKPTIPEVLDTPAFREVWSEWCTFTRERGAELTNEDQARQLKLLAKLSPEAAIADIRSTMESHPLKDSRLEAPTPDAGAAKDEGAKDKKKAKGKAAPKSPGKAGEAAPKGAGKTEGDVRKMGALDAAAKVLVESGQPMNCKEMIDAMAAKGYWSSPNGLTPAATLYSAILRELKTKGKDARFEKTERGKFASTGK